MRTVIILIYIKKQEASLFNRVAITGLMLELVGNSSVKTSKAGALSVPYTFL